MSSESMTAYEADSTPDHGPSAAAPPPRPFLKVAEAALNALREFVASPEAFLSPEDGHGPSESARAAWADTRVRLREFQRETEAYVRAHPTKAILGAAGLGFVLGVLLKR